MEKGKMTAAAYAALERELAEAVPSKPRLQIFCELPNAPRQIPSN